MFLPHLPPSSFYPFHVQLANGIGFLLLFLSPLLKKKQRVLFSRFSAIFFTVSEIDTPETTPCTKIPGTDKQFVFELE